MVVYFRAVNSSKTRFRNFMIFQASNAPFSEKHFVMCREYGVRMHCFDEVCTRPEGRRPNVESFSRTFLLHDAVFQEQMFFKTQQEAEIILSHDDLQPGRRRLQEAKRRGRARGSLVRSTLECVCLRSGMPASLRGSMSIEKIQSQDCLGDSLLDSPFAREPLSKRLGPGSGSPVYLQILREHEEAPGLEVQATGVASIFMSNRTPCRDGSRQPLHLALGSFAF